MTKQLRKKLIEMSQCAVYCDAIYQTCLTEAVAALEVRQQIEGQMNTLVNLSEWLGGEMGTKPSQPIYIGIDFGLTGSWTASRVNEERRPK